MTWNDITTKYGQFITEAVEDSETYPCKIQTYFASQGDAERALGRISNDIASKLRPEYECFSEQSGARRFHVVHGGTLSGSQYKEYLITVVSSGGEIWEAFAR